MILFTHSYFYRLDAKQWQMQQPYPPLMTILAASLMRENGYEVALFDSGLAKGVEDILPKIKQTQPKYLVIFDDGFNYLTKMCLTVMRESAFQMIKIAKNADCQVIVCSSDATDHAEKYLQNGADFVLLGEGEMTLLALINHLEAKNGTWRNLEGISYLADNQLIKNPKRNVMRDLDDLPIPAWDLINMIDYQEVWQKKHAYFSLNLATTRGCPYKCNWCAKPIYGNRYNSRSPEKVVEEIEFLVQNYQVNHFWFCDDIFGLKPNWIQEFRDLIRAKGLKIRYKIQSRVDLLLEEDNIQALVDSGLETAWVGAESGSQSVLDAMDKGTQVSQIYEATRLLKQQGVRVAFFIQFGYLAENQGDIQKTIQMVLDLMPDDLGVSVSYPLPGTKFYEKVKNDLQIKANWKDSDDLDLMFKNTYSSEYYKRLHRYLHKAYRRKKAYLSISNFIHKPFKINLLQIKLALSILYYLPASWWDNLALKRLGRF